MLSATCATAAGAQTISSKQRAASAAGAPARLVRQLVRARTVGARVRAIDEVLRTLQIAVYDGRGHVVVPGVARGPRDLYLYDFEVRAMADALGRGERFGVSDLAELLNHLGIGPISVAAVGQIIRAGAGAAIHRSHDPAALLPSIVRMIGLTRRPSSDIARDPAPQFDPLQYFLLQAAFVGPALDRGSAGGRRGRTAAAAGDGPCPGVKFGEEGPPVQIGDEVLSWWLIRTAKKEATEWWKKLEKAGEVKELLEKIVEWLHGGLLAYSLDVKRVASPLDTAYGPPGTSGSPNAGQPIKFQIRVVMLDDLGKEKVDCLAMAGIKIPHKGPVEGIPIKWQIGANGNLRKHGTLNPAPNFLGLSESKTGPDGVATLTFTPNNEIYPGYGFRYTDNGAVDGIAAWADATDNGLGKFAQYLTPKFDTIGWNVTYHQQYVFDATVSGTQDSSWNSTVTSNCDGSGANDVGNQTLQFSSPQTFRLLFYVGSTGVLTVAAPPQFVSPLGAQFTLSLTDTRHDASTPIGTPSPDCASSGGGGGGPPPDCGTASGTAQGQFAEKPDGVHMSIPSLPSLYTHCGANSPGAYALKDFFTGVEPSAIENEDQATIDAQGSQTFPENSTNSAPGKYGFTATNSGQSTVNYHIVLTRVKPTAP